MQRAPGSEEQQGLLDAVDELIEEQGLAAYVGAPILLPQTRFFPDPWTPDLRGVYLLARRLLAYAGLAELQVGIASFTEEDPPPLSGTAGVNHSHQGVAAWFAGITDGVCHFGVRTDQLESADKVVAAMAHEVCHAYRTHHGLCVDDDALEERLTDLTSSYLGFGVLTLNASYLYRSSGYTDGQQAVTTWSHSQLGYLSPQAMAFLLAVQLEVRQVDGAAARQLLAEVETNQASYVRESRRLLAERFPGEALLEELGLPPRLTWPSPVSLERALAVWDSAEDVRELRDAAGRARAEQAAAEAALEAAGEAGLAAALAGGWVAGSAAEGSGERPVDTSEAPEVGPRRAVRLAEAASWSGFFIGLCAGALASYLIGSFNYLTLGLIVVATYVGWRVGRALVRHRCSACSRRVTSETTCPGCQSQLATGWLDDPDDDDELTREALAAGEALKAEQASEAAEADREAEVR